MGFLQGALSPMLTAATQVGGAAEGAQVKAAQLKQQMMIAAITMRREQQLADIKQAVANSVIPKNAAETTVAVNKGREPVLGDPGYAAAMGGVAGAESQAKLPADLQLAVTKGIISKDEATTVQSMRSQTEQGIATQRVGAEATQGAANRAATAANTAATTAGGMARVKQTQAGSLTGRILGVPGAAAPPSQQQQDWDTAAAHAKATGQDPVAALGPRPDQ
jgi:hypothetical protein